VAHSSCSTHCVSAPAASNPSSHDKSNSVEAETVISQTLLSRAAASSTKILSRSRAFRTFSRRRLWSLVLCAASSRWRSTCRHHCTCTFCRASPTFIGATLHFPHLRHLLINKRRLCPDHNGPREPRNDWDLLATIRCIESWMVNRNIVWRSIYWLTPPPSPLRARSMPLEVTRGVALRVIPAEGFTCWSQLTISTSEELQTARAIAIFLNIKYNMTTQQLQ